MKKKTFTPVGALHPFLFFATVYLVSLFFLIFIFSTVFYSCNSASDLSGNQKDKQIQNPKQSPGHLTASLHP